MSGLRCAADKGVQSSEPSRLDVPPLTQTFPRRLLWIRLCLLSFPFYVGIDWKYFLVAIPLAALTGVLTMTSHPLTLFVFLPANLVWAISRYRRHRPVVIGSGQGAHMGAMMGLLTFAFFLAFFLITIPSHAQYRDIMINQVNEIAAQNPDPQAQQMRNGLLPRMD